MPENNEKRAELLKDYMQYVLHLKPDFYTLNESQRPELVPISCGKTAHPNELLYVADENEVVFYTLAFYRRGYPMTSIPHLFVTGDLLELDTFTFNAAADAMFNFIGRGLSCMFFNWHSLNGSLKDADRSLLLRTEAFLSSGMSLEEMQVVVDLRKIA